MPLPSTAWVAAMRSWSALMRAPAPMAASMSGALVAVATEAPMPTPPDTFTPRASASARLRPVALTSVAPLTVMRLLSPTVALTVGVLLAVATEPLAASPMPALPAMDCALAVVRESALRLRLPTVSTDWPTCSVSPALAVTPPPSVAVATDAPTAAPPATLTPTASLSAVRSSLAETLTSVASTICTPSPSAARVLLLSVTTATAASMASPP